MKHDLSITWLIPHGRSNYVTVVAETDIGELPHVGSLDSVAGKLVNITPELLSQLKYGCGVDVTFCSAAFKFSRLENDRTFALHGDRG